MKELKEVFGHIESPVLRAADILDRTFEIKEETMLQDDRGSVFSLLDIESKMNDVARALLAIGVVAGDRIAIVNLDYADAILLQLGAEQIGVNVVNVSSDGTSFGQITHVKPRITFSQDIHDVVLQSAFGEYLIVKEGLVEDGDSMLHWDTFLSLKRFATEWELERFRVFAA